MLEIFKQTGPELKFKSRDALLAVITIGGMRDHGPHLGSAAELRLLEFYSSNLRNRFYPYIFLTPGITYSIGDGAILALSPEIAEGLVKDITFGVKSLGIGKVMGLTCGRDELEVVKKSFEMIKGIKTYAFGIWEFYPQLEAFEGEDPLSKGGPYITSQLMYVDKSYVKDEMLKYLEPSPDARCDPRKSSPELGKIIVEKVLETIFTKSDEIMRD